MNLVASTTEQHFTCRLSYVLDSRGSISVDACCRSLKWDACTESLRVHDSINVPGTEEKYSLQVLRALNFKENPKRSRRQQQSKQPN